MKGNTLTVTRAMLQMPPTLKSATFNTAPLGGVFPFNATTHLTDKSFRPL